MEHLLELIWDEGTLEDTLSRVLLVTIFTYGHLSHLLRAEGRRRHRLYLCRPELVPNPRIGSPWQFLYQSQSDRAFITTMGIDTTTFQVILDVGFKQLWDLTPIPRTDTNIHGEPRLGARSLDAAGGLGLYLHYLRSSMRELGLQLIFALIPSTVNRYLGFARQILLTTLRKHPASRVTWLDDDQLDEMTNLVQVTTQCLVDYSTHTETRCSQARHPKLVGAVGALDGLKLPVEVSSDSRIENAMYNGWLHSHFISNVIAFAPTGLVLFHFYELIRYSDGIQEKLFMHR